MLALNRAYICHLYYMLIRQRVSFTLPPSLNLLSQPLINNRLLLPIIVFDMLALPFGIPSLIISDLPTLTLSSNPI